MNDARNAWREPMLEEILSDEIVRALMAADRVDRHELQAMLTEVARRIGQGPPLQPADNKAAEPGSAPARGVSDASSPTTNG